MALPVNCSTHLISAYYSFYRPQKDERLSWPSWLTYSGWLTHISGHPSVAGRAQDRESSPARDRRSTTEPRHQLRTQCCSVLLAILSAACCVNLRRCLMDIFVLAVIIVFCCFIHFMVHFVRLCSKITLRINARQHGN